RSGGPPRAGGRPRLGSGRRQTAPRPAYGQLRTPGGHAGRGRCGGRQLVSSHQPASTTPITSPELANLFKHRSAAVINGQQRFVTAPLELHYQPSAGGPRKLPKLAVWPAPPE